MLRRTTAGLIYIAAEAVRGGVKRDGGGESSFNRTLD